MTPQLMQSPLTGKFYIVTRIRKDGSAAIKYDCSLAVEQILGEVKAEAAELKALLRSLYWCAVNDTRVDPKVEDAIRTVLGEKPKEHGGEAR